jgi:hypothetical protein
VSYGFARRIGLAEEGARMLEQDQAFAGQLDAARAAGQERDAEVLLETRQLRRQRGLRDVGALRGTREAARIRDVEEVAKSPQADWGMVHRDVRSKLPQARHCPR